MNSYSWNVVFLTVSEDGFLTIAVTSPNVSGAILDEIIRPEGQRRIAHVGDGFPSETHAMAFVSGADGGGGLVYDRLLRVEMEVGVSA